MKLHSQQGQVSAGSGFYSQIKMFDTDADSVGSMESPRFWSLSWRGQ